MASHNEVHQKKYYKYVIGKTLNLSQSPIFRVSFQDNGELLVFLGNFSCVYIRRKMVVQTNETDDVSLKYKLRSLAINTVAERKA